MRNMCSDGDLSLVPKNIILEIYGCKDYPLNWRLITGDDGEIQAGSINCQQQFIIENLAILNGDEGTSIFVTNNPHSGDKEEFNLDNIVYDNRKRREKLIEILAQASCRLRINVPR
jgi:DNA-binding cell septation regulator SpoVG